MLHYVNEDKGSTVCHIPFFILFPAFILGIIVLLHDLSSASYQTGGAPFKLFPLQIFFLNVKV